jgi:hypothetical protein
MVGHVTCHDGPAGLSLPCPQESGGPRRLWSRCVPWTACRCLIWTHPPGQCPDNTVLHGGAVGRERLEKGEVAMKDVPLCAMLSHCGDTLAAHGQHWAACAFRRRCGPGSRSLTPPPPSHHHQPPPWVLSGAGHAEGLCHHRVTAGTVCICPSVLWI